MTVMIPGREHVGPYLPIYGRGSWTVKAILRYIIDRRSPLLGLVAAVAIAAAGLKKDLRQKLILSFRKLAYQLKKRTSALRAGPDSAAAAPVAAEAAPERQEEKGSSASASASSPSVVAKKPKEAARVEPRFWDLIIPEKLPGGLSEAALPEVIALAMISLTNAWLLLYKAWLMREFVTGQNLGQWRRWLKALAFFPVATLASAFLAQATKYLQNRVSLIWRYLATQRLMGQYFSNMNYYKLLHHGKLRIDDPDIRMCADVGPAFDALTGVLLTGLSNLATTLASGWALYRRRGVMAVMFAYTYSIVVMPMSIKSVFPDWSVLGLVSAASGAYNQALTRVQLNLECVAMLRGSSFEVSVLEEHATKYLKALRSSWKEMAVFEWVQHIFTAPGMPGMWQTVASFGAAFIALRAAGSGRPVLDAVKPNQEVVYEFGANISDFWHLFYTVRGASTLVGLLETWKRTSASFKRIEQLQRNLQLLDMEQNQPQTEWEADDAIVFKDVSISTPTGVPLVAKLSFRLDPGQHLLICGHNGAGKSSIFRCLGGLWPVAEGSISTPDAKARAQGQGLHDVAYYLPQNPANVLGTLSDQLTYPVRVDGGLPEAELRQWLSYVQLEHLVENLAQAGTLQDEADWASKLSLGEQQRLGIARLLYHLPRFAILDECTSAVSKDMERWLFEVTRELGISCVTIAHRPALQEHHHQMLELTGTVAEDGHGWRMVDLKSSPPPNKPLAADAAEVHGRVQELLRSQGRRPNTLSRESVKHMEDRSTPYRNGDAASKGDINSMVMKRWPSSLQRIAAALQLEHVDVATGMYFVGLVLCMIARPQVAWEVYRTVAGSITRSMCSDGVGLCAELIVNITYAAGLCTLERFMDYLGRQCQAGVWRCLAKSLHQEVLAESTLHRLPALDNAVQRIAGAKTLVEDLKQQFMFTGHMVIQMCFYMPMLLRGGGALPGVTVVGLYMLHYLVRTRWMPNFKAITAKHDDLEDRFQVSMTRMRHVAEFVAFSGGGDLERLRVQEQFDRLRKHRMDSLKQEFMYNLLTDFFITYDNLPIWFHRMLSFNFAWRNVPTAGPSPASAVQNYLYDRTISVNLVGVQSLASVSSEWAKLDGKAMRILELRELLENPAAANEIAGSTDSLLEIAPDNKVTVKGLDLVSPVHDCLAEGLSFEVGVADGGLLVTGPNGSGKTMLARALLGLTPLQGDGVKVDVPDRLMIAPQRVYLPKGSLGDQVTYPRSFHMKSDEALALQALRAAGLEYLLERAGEQRWDMRSNWEETLSGGEQQRFGLARVFFHRPPVALFDECTSMVAVDKEEALYQAAVQDFGIVPITFSQRLFLPQFHKKELRLGDDTRVGWTLKQL